MVEGSHVAKVHVQDARLPRVEATLAE